MDYAVVTLSCKIYVPNGYSRTATADVGRENRFLWNLDVLVSIISYKNRREKLSRMMVLGRSNTKDNGVR